MGAVLEYIQSQLFNLISHKVLHVSRFGHTLEALLEAETVTLLHYVAACWPSFSRAALMDFYLWKDATN